MARTPPGYYLHLVAWAQIGVLIRVYLAELFGSACPTVHGAPCLASNGSRWGGAFFTDLPANVLGSFLMGLFVSSDVLSNSLKHILTVEAPLAMLPVRSPLQQHLAFQLGLRTGLCGSLTTFASWLTQMVLMIVGGNHTSVLAHTQWVEALGGLLLGTLAAVAALVVGQHCVLALYHRLNPGAFIPYGSPAPEQQKLELAGGQEQQQAGRRDLQADSEGVRRLRTVSSTREGSTMVVVVAEEGPAAAATTATAAAAAAAGGGGGGVVVVAEEGSPPAAAAAAAAAGAAGGGSQHLHSLTSFSAGTTPPALELAALDPHNHPTQQPHQQQQWQQQQGGPVPASAAAKAGQQGVVNGAAGLSSASDAGVSEMSEEEEAPSVSASGLVVDGFAVMTIAVLTGVSLWRVIQGNAAKLATRDDPFSQEWFWWSILLGPFGCWLRYYLSRYNGKLHGSWKWFPLGTFAANMTACVIDYVMKVVPVRHPMDRTSLAVLAGVVGGVGGCLSTVSTWVVEVQRLLLSFPKTSHGYQYICISLGTALLLGLTIYGIPVWTMQ